MLVKGTFTLTSIFFIFFNSGNNINFILLLKSLFSIINELLLYINFNSSKLFFLIILIL